MNFLGKPLATMSRICPRSSSDNLEAGCASPRRRQGWSARILGLFTGSSPGYDQADDQHHSHRHDGEGYPADDRRRPHHTKPSSQRQAEPRQGHELAEQVHYVQPCDRSRRPFGGGIGFSPVAFTTAASLASFSLVSALAV